MKKSLILTSLLATSVMFTACGGGGDGGGGGSTSSSGGGQIDPNAPTITTPSNFDVVAGKLKSFTLTTGENVIHSNGNPAFKFQEVVKGSVADINPDTGDILFTATNQPITVKFTATRVSTDGTLSSVVSAPTSITFTPKDPLTVAVKKPIQTGAANDVATNVARTYTKDVADTQNITGPNGLIWGDNRLNAKLDNRTYLGAVDFCSGQGAGWRIPTLDELLDLMDYSKAPFAFTQKPMIGGSGANDVFTNNLINVWAEEQFGKKIFVSENAGTLTYNNDGTSLAVRCVKGAKSNAPHLIYSDLTDTTYDESTKLQWSAPSATEMVAADGIAYCSALGNGYRLPSINELRSVVENGTVANVITAGNRQLLSATPYVGPDGVSGPNTWILVLKEDGTISVGAGNDAVRINCVRDF